MSSVVTSVGNALLILAAIPANAAPAIYARAAHGGWRTSAWGRHLMAYMTSVALVLDVGVLRLAIHDSPWFAVVRTVAFATTVCVLWWRLKLVVDAYREGPPATPRPVPDRNGE